MKQLRNLVWLWRHRGWIRVVDEGRGAVILLDPARVQRLEITAAGGGGGGGA